jgi:hypothetical protein
MVREIMPVAALVDRLSQEYREACGLPAFGGGNRGPDRKVPHEDDQQKSASRGLRRPAGGAGRRSTTCSTMPVVEVSSERLALADQPNRC